MALPFEHKPGKSPNVTHVTIEVKKMGQRFPFLLQSDEHIDNAKSDLKLLKKHHEEAADKGAGIIKVGDTFCAMQGKEDKRSSLSALRDEHKRDEYVDELVNWAADFYEPYTENMILVGDGNHEQGLNSRYGTNLNKRLCKELAYRTGWEPQHTGYTGFVRFQFRYRSERWSKLLFYTHGWGSGGGATKGVSQSAYKPMAMLDGVDIIASGHSHDQWEINDMQLGCNKYGEVYHKPVKILKLGNYKNAYGDGIGGFEVKGGHGPKPMGAMWLEFEYARGGPVIHTMRAQ